MEEPAQKKEYHDHVITDTSRVSEEILRRRDTAFNVALGKLLEAHGDAETVMQTGEAFGRGLFTEFINEKPEEWTMKDWLDATIDNIFDPLDTSFTIAEVRTNEARSLITQRLLHENLDESHAASLFTYGIFRGLFLSAFPKGELIMGNTIALDQPVTEFTFKTNASRKDKFERQRIKNLFIITKKL